MIVNTKQISYSIRANLLERVLRNILEETKIYIDLALLGTLHIEIV